MKVLFFTKYPLSGASSRYRVYQYLPHFEDMGIHCDVYSFMNEEMYALSHTRGATLRKAWLTAKATVARLRQAMRCADYDLVYLQRDLFPFGPPLVERWLKYRGATLCFDYDDALFIKKASRYNPIATLFRSNHKVYELFTLVDCVVAGNSWLEGVAKENGAPRAVTVEVAEDVNRVPFPSARRDQPALTIGWLGSPSTVKYLRLIEPVLQRIAREYSAVRFVLVGGGGFVMDGVPWEERAWSLSAELETLAQFDVGLMPLPIEEWSLGKSGGKARTYMAAGVVPVCTDIGYNQELIAHGKTGFLCLDEADWYQTIRQLLDDADKRREVSAAAREYVAENFSVRGQAQKLNELFTDLV